MLRLSRPVRYAYCRDADPAEAARRIRGVLAAVVVGAAVVASAACSLDYGESLAENLDEGVPDTVVFGFSHTVVENGSPRFRIEAGRGESYQSRNLMKLDAVRFIEYADDGSGTTEGRAGSADFYTDTESAELSGDVRFYDASEGVTITSGYLKWDGEARLLESRAETITTISDDDGTRLSGSGFSADAARRSFTFGNRADGRYVEPVRQDDREAPAGTDDTAGE